MTSMMGLLIQVSIVLIYISIKTLTTLLSVLWNSLAYKQG